MPNEGNSKPPLPFVKKEKMPTSKPGPKNEKIEGKIKIDLSPEELQWIAWAVTFFYASAHKDTDTTSSIMREAHEGFRSGTMPKEVPESIRQKLVELLGL